MMAITGHFCIVKHYLEQAGFHKLMASVSGQVAVAKLVEIALRFDKGRQRGAFSSRPSDLAT